MGNLFFRTHKPAVTEDSGANLDANGTAGTELITGRSGCPCVQLHSQATHLANVLPCLWLWVAVLGASLNVGRV